MDEFGYHDGALHAEQVSIEALAEENNCALEDVPLADMQNVEAAISENVFSVLSVDNSVASRRAFGGTAPDNVRARVAHWQNWLSENAPS